EDIKIAVVIEDARVDQLVLRGMLVAAAVLLDQPRVGKFSLRVLVQVLHVGMRGRRVEIEVVFFDVLAVIPLAARQPEGPLFEDRISTVPQRNGKANELAPIADAGQPIFIPPVGLGPRMVVRQVIPRGAVRAVVLAHCSPRPLAEVRPPALPMPLALGRFLQALGFGGEFVLLNRSWHGWRPHFASTTNESRRASPTDQAWKGQPRGECGGSPSAISEMCPTPAS